MRVERSGPVTFGQLSVLRSVQHLGPPGPVDANTAQVWPLPPGVTARQVNGAWHELLLRNESLRTTYDAIGSREPIQRVLPVPCLTLPVVDVSEAGADAVWEAATALTSTALDLGTDLPWRAAVITRDGQATHLVASFHHICADDTGMRSVATQVRELLDGNPQPAGAQPLELAAEQRAAHRRHERVLHYWADRWDGFVAEDRSGMDRTWRSQATLYSLPALTAAEAVSTRLKVSVQAVALSAAFIALLNITGRSAATFGLMASNRFSRRWATVVSSLNQLAPMTAAPQPGQTPDDFVRTVYASSMEAYSNGAYNVDDLRDLLVTQDRSGPEPMEFNCYFNFVGELATSYPPTHPAARAVAWQRPRRQSGPSFHLAVGTGAGMTFTLRASEAFLGEPGIAAVLTGMEAVLIELAAGAAADVAAINTRPVRRLESDQTGAVR
ncbi:condensation domain-containing protein [Micromonospora sp. NPDC049051]|uniref:condensation domain-containing protein n=1 Tax=Micromonospora sp. NPDC049051 TaxID=3364264 RepID=UPI003720E0F8